MKNFKKFSFGLTAILLLTISLLGKTGHASAAAPASITFNNTTYTAAWIDRSDIKINATTKAGKTTSTVLKDDAWGSNWSYTATDHPSWSSCGSMTMNGFGSAVVGMTSRAGRGSWGPSDSYGSLTVDTGSCSNDINNQQIKISNWQNASISFQATASDTIQIVDQGQSMSFSNPRLQSDGTVRYYQDGQWGDNCQRIIAVNFNKSGLKYFPYSWMEYFDQTSNGTSTSLADPNCQVTFTQSSPPKHGVGSEDAATISNYSYILANFSALKKPNTVQDGNGSGSGNGGSSTDPSCESELNSSFNWILCDTFRGMDWVAKVLSNFVDDQMCVNTGTSSTGSGVSCPGANIYGSNVKGGPKNGVQTAWSSFREIASALLVIIMLVMVISQAVGGGPFDAYTVRKLLPKMVAAVIFIQLSWVLTKFAIDVSNDLGKGIQNLLEAPFGGASNLSLGNLVGATFHQYGGGTTDTTTFIVAAGAIVGAAVAGWAGLALLMLYIVLGLFTAFVVLIFRKLFLILLIITAPLAFILWILPGTERYWKMWLDNFTKLLMMFPLIMALIASGKIFAYITAGSNSSGLLFTPKLGVAHLGPLPVPYIASVTTFIDLAIVILAYFGPYFLLPKAYQWGGSMMSMAGKGIDKGVQSIGKPGADWLKWRQGLNNWNQARSRSKAEVERQAKLGYDQRLGGTGLRSNVARTMLLQGRRGRGRIVQSAELEIEKQRHEDEQRAVAELTQRVLPRYAPGSQDAIREAIATRSTRRVRRMDGTWEDFNGAQYANTHEHGQRAALERALVHGQMGVVDQYYTEAMRSGDAERIAEATRFKDDNAEVLGRKLTHVLKGYGVAVRATAGEISQQSGHEVESIIAHYSSRANDASLTPAERAEARAELNGYIQRHYEARANSATAANVDLRGSAAVDAYTEVMTSPNPAAPATVAAHERLDEINTGARARAAEAARAAAAGEPPNPDVDREANRSRYQSPGTPPDQTIPLIQH